MTNVECRALNLCIANLNVVEATARYARAENPMRGKCYPASIALLEYLGGTKSGYHLCRGQCPNGETHYWVETLAGEILDPTARQYTDFGQTPPYRNSKRVGYRPTVKRHVALLSRMRELGR
jgi:hypothetical protein